MEQQVHNAKGVEQLLRTLCTSHIYGVLGTWQSGAYLDAAILDAMASYPVIIMSNNVVMPLTFRSTAVELASHGYIVINTHPAKTQSYGFTDKGFEVGDFVTDLDAMMEMDIINNIMVLDRMAELETLATKMDMDHIGIMGHSIGGGIAWETAHRDNRITAGISIDGDFGLYSADNIEQPFLYMYQSEDYYPDGYYGGDAPAYHMRVNGFKHGSFTDYKFWPGIRERSGIQPAFTTADRAHEVVMTYLIAFFDEYLKGEEQALLDGKSEEYPEIAAFGSINTE